MGYDLYAWYHGEGKKEKAAMMREADLRDTVLVVGALLLAIGVVWYIMLLP
jgi:hypothetical protein